MQRAKNKKKYRKSEKKLQTNPWIKPKSMDYINRQESKLAKHGF